MDDFLIRAVKASDRQQWDGLFAAYAKFYGVTQTEKMRDTVWSWLHDPQTESRGLVAEREDGQLVGIAHFRPFARPLSATTGCFLDDLFVHPEARGTGVADALIERLREIASENGWSVVRWITAEDNYRARAVYDRLANKSGWVTYDVRIG